ncbi:hypothetical protein AVEN_144507-1 [Araneus ventricosus]|uniref:Uncharacterized protein n=1 Tax=Araneus ventricosus TaxID=182803 RepID=A0A4Y2T1S5_ARAVE|nr:hypothetical protein AVEN_144507-1 [Araneus ventricosus]
MTSYYFWLWGFFEVKSLTRQASTIANTKICHVSYIQNAALCPSACCHDSNCTVWMDMGQYLLYNKPCVMSFYKKRMDLGESSVEIENISNEEEGKDIDESEKLIEDLEKASD